MSNPNQLTPAGDNNESTGWESLTEVDFSPVGISTEGVSRITLSDAPMSEGRKDQRVDVTDAAGVEKRTSNLMLGYNKREVQVGKEYLSLEELKAKALESLESDNADEVVYYVNTKTGEQFAEPRQVVDDIVASITGVGPEAEVSNNTKITNQDARSVEFSGPNGETQRGVFMLGNNGIQMPNGTYVEKNTVDPVIENYAKATKKEVAPEPNLEPTPTPTPESAPVAPEPAPESSPDSAQEQTPDKDFHQATLELAELYARSRQLIPAPGTREKFEKARKEYQKLMLERLSSMGQAEYSAGFDSLSSGVQTMATELATENLKELTAFVGGDLNNPNKTPEEIAAKSEELRRAAEAKMKEKYPEMVGDVETAVTAKVIEEYAKMRAELEEATIDALDNGTICRKAVSKIITNKWVKRGLLVAAAAGLVVAAVGISRGVADGSLAVSLKYTAGGVVAGAIRGGLTGALMSRQDSKTSAIRDYGSEVAENIEERINAGEHITAESLATEAMSDYADANRADLHSNRVKTTVATATGAALGAAASGVHIDDVVRSTTTEQVQTGTNVERVQTGTIMNRTQIGTTPERYDVDLSKIDIHKGSGLGEAFTDMGGDPAKISEAVKIANQLDSQYSMVPGSNGVVSGVGGKVGDFAHTYPGTVDTWPQNAREYITQVVQKWAESGLIDAPKTGGEAIFSTVETPVFATVETPIFSAVEKTVVSYLPNLFYEALVQAEAVAMSGVAAGTASLSGESGQEESPAEDTSTADNKTEPSYSI